jgi:CubicO group peptidase (beta-lactamase class C family)
MVAPRRLVLILATGAVALGACAGESADTASPTTPDGGLATSSTTTEPTVDRSDAYDFSAVSPIVDAFVEERGLTGAGLIVVHRDDGMIYEDYWGEFDEDRISLVASSSKMVTAGVLLHLQDQGLLDIDAPVADVAPWGSAHPEITPAQLVSNSSGLVGLVSGAESLPYLCQYSPVGTLQACAETIFTTPGDDEHVVAPDTEFRYGGGQWQVAGAVAEIASGKPWHQLIEEIYVEPCDLDVLEYNNHFLQFSSPAFQYPDAFAGDPSQLEPTQNPNMEGGLYVKPGDYAKLLLMHLRDGRCGDTQVLSPEALATMHADRIGPAYDGDAGGAGVGYGMGWWVDRASGIIRDPGAYGAVPWLDLEDGYGAYLVVEERSDVGMALATQLTDVIDAAVAGA